ncbi:MAG TPA: hypothetical protein VHY80_05070, partial [Stellaceae bacterium]|nr:hypothetical protein [Stellaceae bacterium]
PAVRSAISSLPARRAAIPWRRHDPVPNPALTKAAHPGSRLSKVLPEGFMPEFDRFYFDIAQIARRPSLLAL